MPSVATALHRVDEGASRVDKGTGARAHGTGKFLDTLVDLIRTEGPRSRPFHALA